MRIGTCIRCGDLCGRLCSLEVIFNFLEPVLERSMACMSPIYILIATGLMLAVAYAFFMVLLPEISPGHGSQVQLVHTPIALMLLFNVLFNYFACVFTSPGTTAEFDYETLESKMQDTWRFCKKCRKPKPDLAHHCSICRRCVLKMDHHCPWVGNCIGFRNYRYFFLFLLYLTISCAYAAILMALNTDRFLNHHTGSLWFRMFTMVLAAAAGVAVGGLFLWHFFLVWTGQGTIDFYDNFESWAVARKLGRTWRNPYNLGPMRNWKAVFDVDGRYWWFTWLLPSLRKKKGSGLVLLRADDGLRGAAPVNRRNVLNMV